MKKLPILLFLVTVILLVYGCESATILDTTDGTGGGTEPVTAEDLVATGDDSYPQNQADAIALYAGVMELFNAELSSNASALEYASKSVETDTTPLDWSGAVGEGTVDITGSMRTIFSEPDSFAPEARTMYNDLISATFQMEYQGTIDGATLSDYVNTYTLSGEVDSDTRMNMNVDIEVGDDLDEGSDATIDMDYSIYASESHALSILRDDGLGAKILLSYAVSQSWTDISLDFIELDTSGVIDSTIAWLEFQTVNMKLYNDANELIGDYTVPVTELTDFSQFEY